MLSLRDWNTTSESQKMYRQLETTSEYKSNTVLIAGLTTGLVVVCMILATFGLFVFYRRRKRVKEQKMDFSIQPITPIPPVYLPPPLQQYDPFIIGAQSLQIPHLDEPTVHLDNEPMRTRRSLEIQPTCTKQSIMERASSVKISRYDHQPTRLISAQPKLVRINTVLRTDPSGQMKKTCIKTTPSSGTIDFYLCPPPSNTSSKSTLADGSITVFFEQP